MPATKKPRSKTKLTGAGIKQVVKRVMLDPFLPKPKPNKKKENLLERLTGKAVNSKFYFDHITELNDVLQEELQNLEELHGMKLNINMRLIPANGNHSSYTKLVREGHFDPENARIWIQQIETFAEMLYWAVLEPWRSQVVIGSTQLGKTMIMILAFVKELVLAAVTGDQYKAIYLAPVMKSLGDDAVHDFKDFLAFYDFEVQTEDDDAVKFSDYRKVIGLSGLGEKEDGDIPIRRRASGSIKEEILSIMKACHADGKKLILIVDECHWGSNDTGIMAEILKVANGLSARQMAKKVPGDIMIAISATPFNLGNIQCLRRIFCRTYNGYIGYAFYNGQLLDPRYPQIYPEVLSFDSPLLATRFGTPDFKYVNRTLYLNCNAYERELEKKDRRGELKEFGVVFAEWTWEEYRLFCEDKLINLMENCLIHNNELNAKGFIVRFFHKKDDVIEFLERRQKDFDPRIKCVAWQGESARMRLSKYLQEEGVSKDDLKIIFVTGQGRMGNRLDDSDRIYYGADFAPQSNLTAVLQGLLGRMTGAKSVAPIMFLEEKRVEELEVYVRTKGKVFTRKPAARTTIVQDVGTVFRGHSVTLHAELPVGKGITFASLNHSHLGVALKSWSRTILNRWVKSKPKSSKPPKINGIQSTISAQEKKIFWEIFQQSFSALEKELNISVDSFVRFSTEDHKVSPYLNHQGHAYDGIVGFRDSTRESSTNSNKKSTRNKSGMKKNGDYRCLQPQLLFRWVRSGQTWVGEAESIQFSLTKPMLGGDFNMVVMPTNKDVGHTYFVKG